MIFIVPLTLTTIVGYVLFMWIANMLDEWFKDRETRKLHREWAEERQRAVAPTPSAKTESSLLLDLALGLLGPAAIVLLIWCLI